MQVVSAELVKSKKVLLRLDIDVPLLEVGSGKWEVGDEFRLKAGLPTLRLCLENAEEVIIMGHVGRPNGEDSAFSVEPIYDWLAGHDDLHSHMSSGKLKLLENLRFEKGEEEADPEYAKELAQYGDFFVNEAFAAHHKSASTTVLPTLLPHAAGLRFAEEVRVLREVRDNPKRPLVVIIGGVKIEDKGPAIEAMSKIADTVFVGGKIASEITQRSTAVEHNVILGKLNDEEMDINEETVEKWKQIIKGAKMIVWNGPLGKIEEDKYSKGTEKIAGAVLESDAETILGGGDTIGFLSKLGLLDKFSFVSVGGGAMLKFLTEGTLPTIEALD